MILGWFLGVVSVVMILVTAVLLLLGERLARRRMIRRHRYWARRSRRVQIKDPMFARYSHALQHAYWAWNDSWFDRFFGLAYHTGHWVVRITDPEGVIRFSVIDPGWMDAEVIVWNDRETQWQAFRSTQMTGVFS